MIKILILPWWKEWKMKRYLISLADAANRRNIPPYGFSFFPSFLSKNIHFLTDNHESKYLSTFAYKVTEKLLRCSTCWKFRCNFSRNHFPTCSQVSELVFQIFSSSIISHFHIYLFQSNIPSFFACSLIPVMTYGQAEKGKSKFTIRKAWDYMIISHFS